MVSIKLGKGQTISLSSSGSVAIVDCLLIFHLHLLLLLYDMLSIGCNAGQYNLFSDVRRRSVLSPRNRIADGDVCLTWQQPPLNGTVIGQFHLATGHYRCTVHPVDWWFSHCWKAPLHWFSFFSRQLRYNCAWRNLCVLLFRCGPSI